MKTQDLARHYEPVAVSDGYKTGLFEDGKMLCTTGLKDTLENIQAACENLNRHVKPAATVTNPPTQSERIKWLNDYDYEDDYQ